MEHLQGDDVVFVVTTVEQTIKQHMAQQHGWSVRATLALSNAELADKHAFTHSPESRIVPHHTHPGL